MRYVMDIIDVLSIRDVIDIIDVISIIYIINKRYVIGIISISMTTAGTMESARLFDRVCRNETRPHFINWCRSVVSGNIISMRTSQPSMSFCCVGQYRFNEDCTNNNQQKNVVYQLINMVWTCDFGLANRINVLKQTLVQDVNKLNHDWKIKQVFIAFSIKLVLW